MRKQGIAATLALLTVLVSSTPAHTATFDGQRAYKDVLAQCELGPRLPGSEASRQAGEYISRELQRAGWSVRMDDSTFQGVALHNIIASKGHGPAVLIGAHYDSRAQADHDPENQTAPVPGANDGASGAAVLLELARTLDVSKTNREVQLAFFDAEDQGELNGWPWSVGAEQVAANLTQLPEFVIVVDMIGDANQEIYWERLSTPWLNERLWAVAGQLGYEKQFVPTYKHSIIDDHLPFLERNIPAVDIIDFDYPYWHTRSDTADKVSAASLERVGRVLETWLEGLGQKDS